MGIRFEMLAGIRDTQGTSVHNQLGSGGGDSPDIFLGWQATDGFYLADGGP